MYNLDASVVVDLWDNYPIQNPYFDSVWDWFSNKVETKEFVISKVALEEVKHKIIYGKIAYDIPEAKLFIEILGKIFVPDNTVDDLSTVVKIKKILEIEEDSYHAKGVNENDLLIIAIAKRTDAVLVTNEARQGDADKIKIKAKYKIPAVCDIPEVKVENINLQELLHESSLW